jgi:hypothetical protein
MTLDRLENCDGGDFDEGWKTGQGLGVANHLARALGMRQWVGV